MKKAQYSDSEVVTKGFLRTTLNEALHRQNNEIREYVDTRFDSLEGRMDRLEGSFNEFKDFVVDKLDWLVGAFKKFDEDHTVLAHQQSRTHDKLDNHEVRIARLEKKAPSSAS